MTVFTLRSGHVKGVIRRKLLRGQNIYSDGKIVSAARVRPLPKQR